MIEDNLHNYVCEMNTSKKKIFHALVEILQNVSKHAYEVEGLREGIFLMGKKDNKFLVFTGNYIANNKVRALGEHIENLNKLNREELLELYKLTLHLGSTSHDNDLGLGLIDVARDSSEKMQYYLIPVADNYSFYALGVVI